MKPSLDLDSAALAEQYERISRERQFKRGQRLVDELNLRPGDKVLDIGAGTGLVAEYAAGIVGPDGLVIGIDPLAHRIDIAKRKSCPNLAFKVGDAYDLSGFPENHFDAAYMNAVFHWLPEKRAPLRQVLRVLKHGGRLGISTGAKGNTNPLGVIRQRVLSRAPYNRYQAPAESMMNRVNAGEMSGLLTECGFTLIKVEERPSENAIRTAEEAVQFSEASSFGNFLGHLPEELRMQAREDIKREIELTVRQDEVRLQRFQVVAIARKP